MTLTSSSKASPRLHLNFLDGLRGFAALYVVCCHAALLLSQGTKHLPHAISLILRPLAFGHYAVAIFIVLSGFCLMLPVAMSSDGQLRGGWLDYMRRRSRRILPPYYAAFIIAALTMPFVTLVKRNVGIVLENADHLTLSNILTHLLLVHNWSSTYFQSVDGPLWSVATEWQIYFFFPFLLLPLWRRGGLAVAVAAAFAISLLPHFLLPAGHNFDWACPWYLGLFAFGMAGAVVSARRDNKVLPGSKVLLILERAPWGLLTAVSAAAIGAGHFLTPRSSGEDTGASQWFMDILCGLFSMCLLILCSRCARSGKFWLTEILQSRVAMTLGAMSYSLYLFHNPFEQGMIWLLCAQHLPIGLLLMTTFLLIVPAVIGICYLFHLIFERPFMLGKPRSERESEKSALLSPAP
jgi:peptidoglycan/LPS O-acetylase OafA/YrhL